MQKIALTGGIGAGKSVVAKIFETMNIPVYYADVEAKKISQTPEVVSKIIDHFGDKVITNGNIDNKKLASVVFSNPDELKVLNNIVHPELKKDFKAWCGMMSDKPYVVMEAAIIFEAGFESLFDKIINVYAPQELCIQRTLLRDKITREQVLERMNNQMPPEDKNKLSDFVVLNDEEHFLTPQVLEVIASLQVR